MAMQICCDDFGNIDDVMSSEYIRDPKKKMIFAYFSAFAPEQVEAE